MSTCVVSKCKSNSSENPSLAFFSFPRQSYAKAEWMDILSLKRSQVTEMTKICELHFKSMDICAGKKSLKTHAVPVTSKMKDRMDDSDDEFMQCGSDSDIDIIEVVEGNSQNKAAAGVKANDSVKKEEKTNVEEPTETEPSRRPSRRAAQLAVKKIQNSVRNLIMPIEAPISTTPKESQKLDVQSRKSYGSQQRGQGKRPKIFRDQKVWHQIRVPPANLSLTMECHEELLSPVQMEALIRAQNEYNNVMKRLRTLKASNARIIMLNERDLPDTILPPAAYALQMTKVAPVVTTNLRSPNLVTLSPASIAHTANTNPNTVTIMPVQLVPVASTQNTKSVALKTSPTVKLTAVPKSKRKSLKRKRSLTGRSEKLVKRARAYKMDKILKIGCNLMFAGNFDSGNCSVLQPDKKSKRKSLKRKRSLTGRREKLVARARAHKMDKILKGSKIFK